MINYNDIFLSQKEKRNIELISEALSSALKGKTFEITVEETGGIQPDKYIKIELPVCPESGNLITPIDLELKSNGFAFDYFYDTPNCISNERGCIASNLINECTCELPISCYYSQNEKGFSITSTFQKPESIISSVNSLLCCLEYIDILSRYLQGDDSRNGSEMAFEAVITSCGYINYAEFEDYNLFDENRQVRKKDWIDELQEKLYDCDLIPMTVHQYISEYRAELKNGLYPEIRLKNNTLPSDECFHTLKEVQRILLDKYKKNHKFNYVLTSQHISKLLSIPYSSVTSTQDMLSYCCDLSIERIHKMYEDNIDWFFVKSSSVSALYDSLKEKFEDVSLVNRLVQKSILLGKETAIKRISDTVETLGYEYGLVLLNLEARRSDGWLFYGLYNDPIGCLHYMKDEMKLSPKTIIHIIRCEPLILYAYKEVKNSLYAHDQKHIDETISKYIEEINLSLKIEESAAKLVNQQDIKQIETIPTLCAGIKSKLKGNAVMLEAYAHLQKAAVILKQGGYVELSEMVNVIN